MQFSKRILNQETQIYIFNLIVPLILFPKYLANTSDWVISNKTSVAFASLISNYFVTNKFIPYLKLENNVQLVKICFQLPNTKIQLLH